MCFLPQRRAIFRHPNFKKCSETVSSFNILTWKCASRHNGVQFFDIRTFKSAPNLTCFVHFHFKPCFSPAACNFWFFLWPHDSAPAALTNLLLDWPDTGIIEKTQHFATSLTFGADESSFFWLSRYCVFFLLTLLHLICFSSSFQLSILSEVYYLNFLRSVSGYIQIMCYTRSIKSTSRSTSFCWVKVKTLWCAHRHLKTCAEFKLDGHSVDFHFVINDFFMCLWLHLIWQDIPRENQARWTYQKQLT